MLYADLELYLENKWYNIYSRVKPGLSVNIQYSFQLPNTYMDIYDTLFLIWTKDIQGKRLHITQ